MKNFTFRMILGFVALLGYNFAMAQTAPPHTLRGESRVASVSLNWKSPAAAKTLQWHNDNDYDGVNGASLNGEIPTLYLANRFDKSDLKEYSGAVIGAISYFHYRPVLAVSVLLYENDKVVREQEVDINGLALNNMHRVTLNEPYTIRDDVDLKVVVKFVHGTNLDFVGIMDRGPGVEGKGDLYSYDGKTWMNVKRGNFLVTAHIDMPEASEPDGYNVYRGDTKVNATLLDATSVTLKREPKGTYDYSVAAVYGAKEEKSVAISLTNVPAVDTRPVATNVRASVNGLNATVTWRAPFLAESTLTWANGEPDKAMGGTSGTVRKIWAANAFSSDELLSYADHQITAINIMFNAAVTELKLVILEGGTIVYSQDVPADVLSTIKLNEWTKLRLTEPFVIDPSAELSFGYYIVHDKDLYPGKLDKGPAMLNACYIATTTPKSDFNTTKPTWSNIEKSAAANWMLSADVEARSEIAVPVVKDYDLYRDGVMVKSGVKEGTCTDLAEPGTFRYTVVTNYVDGLASEESASASATVDLPATYLRPTFSEKKFEEGELSLKWDVFTDLPSDLKHYGEPAYSFELTDEGKDVDVYMGAEFSAEELSPYSDYEITGVNLYLCNEIKSLEVMVCSDKKTLASKKVTSIKANEMTYVAFDEPVAVPAGNALIAGYHVVYADGKYPIALDAGPILPGGAMISFDGVGWYSITRVDKTFNNNVIVGARVRLKGTKEMSTLSKAPAVASPDASVSSPASASQGMLKRFSGKNLTELKETTMFGINRAVSRAAEDDKPVVKSFRLYCNGSLLTETEVKEYTAALPYGTYTYAVSAVYSNGWESARSDAYSFVYRQPNLSPAPFGLSGTVEGKNLTLLWQSPQSANELSYQSKTSGSKAVGLTRASGVEGYFLISYSADELTDQVGNYITHIKYGLNDVNLNASSVVVYYDRNLVYEQDVDVSTLVAGENTIRLDSPVEIPAGREVCAGYYVQHDNGVKPNLTDEGPAVDEKGNWICTGTSWKTLKSMNKDLDFNWRISAVLQKGNIVIPAARAAAAPAMITYTVYRDGVMLAEDLFAPNYTVQNAADGTYTVTAVVGGVETAPSNAVILGSPTGIAGVESTPQAYYDGSLKQVVLLQAATVSLYDMNGTLLKKVFTEENFRMEEYPAGVYVVDIQLTDGKKQLLKVVR